MTREEWYDTLNKAQQQDFQRELVEDGIQVYVVWEREFGEGLPPDHYQQVPAGLNPSTDDGIDEVAEWLTDQHDFLVKDWWLSPRHDRQYD